MSLRVVEPGLCSLIVDRGRPQSRSLGVPVGGAADRSALAVGNAMLGNPPDAAALEATLVGPVLVALHRLGAVVVGAPFQMSGGVVALAPNKSFTLDVGDELHIGGTKHGARAYLCVVGGFQGGSVLGSLSSLQPLQRGDELRCAESTAAAHLVRPAFAWHEIPSLSPELGMSLRRLRVLPGTQTDWFPAAPNGKPFVLHPDHYYTVSPASNRMGLRLSGPPLPVPAREMISEPVAPGAVQVTRDGQLIVLGVDGQTIGGYPKVSHVISADLDALGQLRPGDRVAFDTVTLSQAQTLHRQREKRIEQVCLKLRLAASAFQRE